MYHTYIYSIGPTLKFIEYQVFGRFLKFSKLPRQFLSDMSDLSPRHIRLARHVHLLAPTCPGLGFPSYIRGLSTPLNPNFTKPLSSLSLSLAATNAFFKLLHRIPSVSRGFDSLSLQNLQTLSGYSLLRYSSRFSLDLFDLLLIFVNVGSLYLGAPLGCRNLALNLV
jgi:hypothetical protein